MTTDTHLCEWLVKRLEQQPPRRVEPSVSLLKGKPYVNKDHSDIRVTFARVREQLKESKQ